MSINEIAQQHARLTRIEGVMPPRGGGKRLVGLVLYFEGDLQLSLAVNCNEDSLLWEPIEAGDELVRIERVFPSVARAYGLFLGWAWEMRNQQGYLDAIQLEFTDASLEKSVIIQFKAAASAMDVFEVCRVKPTV